MTGVFTTIGGLIFRHLCKGQNDIEQLESRL
jgi:hypothetical protein